MKICVWRTGHVIADTVGLAAWEWLKDYKKIDLFFPTTSGDLSQDAVNETLEWGDIHIGYGILRGMDRVFHACEKAGKPWFNIDKGYFKPGHYDGYYRISLRGTQQTFGFDKLKPDYDRWDKLGIEILPMRVHNNHPNKQNCLLCPPTDHVAEFFNIKIGKWVRSQRTEDQYKNTIWRDKTIERSLEWDFECSKEVLTFNSSVGWEALRQGIPVISDPNHSIIGSYVNHFNKTNHIPFDTAMREDINVRRDLFALMASLQLTLDEMRAGLLWPLMQKMISLSTSVTMAAKQ